MQPSPDDTERFAWRRWPSLMGSGSEALQAAALEHAAAHHEGACVCEPLLPSGADPTDEEA
jgi:hypothetical protein